MRKKEKDLYEENANLKTRLEIKEMVISRLIHNHEEHSKSIYAKLDTQRAEYSKENLALKERNQELRTQLENLELELNANIKRYEDLLENHNILLLGCDTGKVF